MTARGPLTLLFAALSLFGGSRADADAGTASCDGEVEEDGVLLATRDVMSGLDSTVAAIDAVTKGAENSALHAVDWLMTALPTDFSQAPQLIRVISVGHHAYASGVYRLLSGRIVNGFPVWQDVLDKENVIYSGASGEWFIGMDGEATEGQSRGWIRSSPHDTKLPHETDGLWTYFDDNGHWSNHDSVMVAVVDKGAQAGVTIPNKLVIVTKHESLAQMQLAEAALASNVANTLSSNKDLKVMWLGDQGCRVYLEQVGEMELVKAYIMEPRGAYRGDICRAVVLKNEGGFYVDTDLQLRRPLRQLVDGNTTFMTATCKFGGLLNAIMGTVAHGSVITEAVQQLKRLYGNQARPLPNSVEVGPGTLIRAMEKVAWQNGGMLGTDLKLGFSQDTSVDRTVGKDHFKIYREQKIDCSYVHEPECPAERKAAFDVFDGARYAIFDPRNHDVVAWSRYASCREYGCHTGGRDGIELSSFTPSR